MQRLGGQAAIVTGGGTGIGRGIALALAAEGASVFICGRRRKPLQAVLKEIEAGGGRGGALPADVSKVEDVRRVVDTAVSEFGTVHILINNAAVSGGAPIHEHDIEDWDRVMAINLRGPFLMARAVLPIMRKQHRGHIINISSESGIEHYQGDGAYGVAKHALNALGEVIQRENQGLGIRVNTICPGMVVTEMTKDASGLDRTKCLYPQDIADLVIWLLTRRSNIKVGLPVLIQTMMNPWE